jgi:hypothetical protein
MRLSQYAKKMGVRLNALKQRDFPWMYECSKCAPQEALRDLDKAYKNFFRRLELKKQGKWKGKLGFPVFKKKSKAIGSFRLTGSIKVYEDAVQLPRLGKLRLHEHKYLPTENVHVLSATVSEHAGREAFGSLSMAPRAQEKLEGVAFRVDSPIEVHPIFSDFDGGLVDFPGVGGGFEVGRQRFSCSGA